MAVMQPACFLTLPSELRNSIYTYVFDSLPECEELDAPPERLLLLSAPIFRFENRTTYLDSAYHNIQARRKLAVLATCRQIHDEAHLMALSKTSFHISGECTYPDLFNIKSRPLNPSKIGAIRHLTLTARISHLRALNETWGGLPFGHAGLDLDTLTIIPRRPDCSTSAYAEVADLSQSHTLAYIFAETLKSLRNVGAVEVRNSACFNDVVWRIVYRSLVYRTWRWGGECCGVRFEASPDADNERDAWFKVHFGDGKTGSDVGEEVIRLAGGEMPDRDAPGM
ncbi:hypothetical protein BAUCODRAFT_33794 [Baudoinia panamericana UAMH 10762]|uniref:F-box domain-containing protein n=1 Tax=Baudoinia panamericana (strain UAMH 10762) TaxID=717646 RepID=M2MIE4_BAUPA|nr:uncharacterized protein BAUCODRAFT_33794 [Baudoinia panamericana UAMH 10762]EMC96441.1 hypothetical protein BAUCODRAFT_33794 [Baudoinia panamericana UAMH 10762]